MATKKEKPIKSIEIELFGGPLNGKKMEVSYPVWESYVLNMGQSLYIKVSSTQFEHTEDWSKRTERNNF